jgi:hypothetical protein
MGACVADPARREDIGAMMAGHAQDQVQDHVQGSLQA